MKTPPSVLLLTDLTGFGRAAMLPAAAALSAMGCVVSAAPTGLFSSHMALPGAVFRGAADELSAFVAHYVALGLRFDAVSSGFLASAEEADAVLAAAALKKEGGLFLADPAMADGGKLYRTATPALVARARDLCRAADVICPNVTEAAILLGRDPAEAPSSPEEALAWAEELAARLDAVVVMTGVEPTAGELGAAVYAEGDAAFLRHKRAGGYYPGTGDLFSAVLLGGLLRGDAVSEAAARAAGFVRDAAALTEKSGREPLHGVLFEPLLGRLAGTP